MLAQIALKLKRYEDCAVLERTSEKYEMVKIAIVILGYDIRQ
jgi:ribosomal protein L30/L7E